MNEFMEKKPEIPSVQDHTQSLENQDYSLDTVKSELQTYNVVTDAKVKESAPDAKEKTNVRDYGLKECCDAAKNIFTKEVLADWGKMSEKQREQIVKDYSNAIGKGLDINFKGVVFETMDPYVMGYNNGDGHVYLNKELINYPGAVVTLIDTIAHEARHQMQQEAIKNPEKFGIDQATVKEWDFGFTNYTNEDVSALDPWGYHYNPVEVDARYFGESVVRELTKGLINNV
jgi:hypothetical protein